MIPITQFQFPTNAILLLTVCFATYLIVTVPYTRKLSRMLTLPATSIISLLLFLACCLIIGLIPQDNSSFLRHFSHSWLMLGSTSFFYIVLAANIFQRPIRPLNQQKIAFHAIHIGLLMIIAGTYFGAPDTQHFQMVISNQTPNNMAFETHRGMMAQLPFDILLDQINKTSSDGQAHVSANISINGNELVELRSGHASKWNHYDIYLQKYQLTNNSQQCTLRIVKRTWLWLIYSGIILMFIGLVLWGLPNKKQER